MTKPKSDKELAFLYDLYIATDWGERFAKLVDEHVKLPREGRALYLEAGTGSHALALRERGGAKLTIVCSANSEACLELARAKAVALHERAEFKREDPQALSFADEQFDLVLVNSSFTAPANVPRVLTEAVRVAKPGATVACWLPTTSSFGEFFSIFWEALIDTDAADHGIAVEHLIAQLPTVSDTEKWSDEAGLDHVTSWTISEEFDYASGSEFLNSPLINDFLMPAWLQSIPKAVRQKVRDELGRIIDDEQHAGKFTLSLKATLVLGKKRRVQ